MNVPKLSTYAREKFIKFLKNKKTQVTINDMIICMNISSMDSIMNLYLTMFLATIEIDKLDKTDIDVLKNEIKNVRSKKSKYMNQIFDEKADERVYKNIPEPEPTYLKTFILRKENEKI